MTSKFTEEELAAFLGRDIRTLARWRAARKGPPFVRLGGKTPYYPKAGVERWLTAGEVAKRLLDPGWLEAAAAYLRRTNHSE